MTGEFVFGYVPVTGCLAVVVLCCFTCLVKHSAGFVSVAV